MIDEVLVHWPIRIHFHSLQQFVTSLPLSDRWLQRYVCTLIVTAEVSAFLQRNDICKPGVCCSPVSVCLSVCHVGLLYLERWRYRQTSFSARYRHHSSFLTPCTDTQFQGEPLKRGCTLHGELEIFEIFDWNLCLSRNRYEIGRWLLWNVSRKSWAPDR